MDRVSTYIYKVYTEGSFSAAAKELFVSQSALSMTIAKFEKEKGFSVFDRKTKPLSLTRQGRIYIDMLEEIMACERTAERKIRQFSNDCHGRLSVGGASSLSQYLLAHICAEFHKNYPHVHVTIDAGNVGKNGYLINDLKNNALDLLLTYSENNAEYDTLPLLTERMVIAMHRDMPGAQALLPYALDAEAVITKSYPRERMLSDLSLFREIPFLVYHQPSSTAPLMKKLLGTWREIPCEIVNSKNSHVHHFMLCTGAGALMTSDCLINTLGADRD